MSGFVLIVFAVVFLSTWFIANTQTHMGFLI